MKYPAEKLTQKAYIYGAVFSLANRLQSMGDRRDEAVTTKQWFAMANIAMMNDFDLNIKQLAHILGTSSQNTKKLMNLLEKKDYVMLQKDKADSRNIRIALTDSGKNYCADRYQREADYLEKLFQGLEEPQIQSLYDNLKTLSFNIINKEEER